MFKSVFTKYITFFMMMIIVSFLVLTLILCRMVGNWSTDVKADIIEKSSTVVSSAVQDMFISEQTENFNSFIYFNREHFVQLISALADYSDDVHILIVDTRGEILAHDDNLAQGYINALIPQSVIDTMKQNGGQRIVGDLEGAFFKKQLIYATPIRDSDGEFVGVTLSCSESQQVETLIGTMVKTIILSCLWVMLASLVAVYFISDRVIAPLKQMSKAAKSFAAGKFDVRVPVKGRDEVAELATAFNNMAASMSKLEDMRRTFLSSVSHDLRTPMTTISGFIDGIIDGTIPPEKHEYYLDIIRNEVRRLARLVASLLDITRIQAGERKFSKSAFDICEMARLILISFEQKIDAKKLEVEFDCKRDKMMVWADRDAIYQILYNICDNAVKFSREGGAYKISILEREKKVYISVFNEGIGIPAEELPFVFERFYKSDKSRGLDKTGVGLGLYIAKTIIDAHEEEIWVRSEHGKNCEFVFTLPYTPEGEIVVKD